MKIKGSHQKHKMLLNLLVPYQTTQEVPNSKENNFLRIQNVVGITR